MIPIAKVLEKTATKKCNNKNLISNQNRKISTSKTKAATVLSNNKLTKNKASLWNPILKQSSLVKVQRRNLNVHEYQSQQLMAKSGIKTARGFAVHTPAEAEEACKKLGGRDWIVKAQILAGGRGKGTFDSGLKGGVHVCSSIADVKKIAEKMLGHKLITKQTGPQGRPVNTLYIVERHYIRQEKYFAIVMDRSFGGPVIVASSQGGVDIEGVAAETPDAIIKEPIDIMKGIQVEQVKKVAAAIGFEGDQLNQAVTEITKLYELFIKTDATLLEINPFVETADGKVFCLDAKINFDDNALFRQKEIAEMKDPTQDDPREVEAAKYDLNYIGLDGNIACLVNGAGLAMATMDIIKLHGGEPANFLDVGGGASEKQVTEAFKILNSDPHVEAILVNIFGGIMRCDVIAAGIINAAKEIGLKKPLVVRLQGTNVDAAKKLMDASGVRIINADDLDQAAAAAVQIAKISEIASKANLGVQFNLPL